MVDPDPVLDMKGMTMEDITLLLKFIYTGEVVIEKGNVEQFLEAANELKIAGLTKSNKSVPDTPQTVEDSIEEKIDSDEPRGKKLMRRKRKEKTSTPPSSASDEMNLN